MTPTPGTPSNRRNALLMICALLALVTSILYWPVTGHDFINYDDHQYITENPHVTSGLTWSGVLWSFQCGYAANWHPLTWMSHMLDCSVFGLHPFGHHLTNLLFHVVNSILVLLLLNQMTGSVWRSALVAALFAWHPLHVESVAWASERKDVLSTLFWILTLMAYLRYAKKSEVRSQKPEVGRVSDEVSSFKFQVSGSETSEAKILAPDIQQSTFSSQHPTHHSPLTTHHSLFSSQPDYWLALLFFVLGLMSKPMLVTLPFVLLLLDFWPLNRFGFVTTGSQSATSNSEPQPAGAGLSILAGLLREKLPFFALTVGTSVLTYLAQKTAIWTGDDLPLRVRLANAAISYLRYVGKTVWPTDLTLIYPYQQHWPVSFIIGAFLFLTMGTGLFVLWARRHPPLIVGWLWYLGTLVPVIGLVQVGDQAMADRYMYIPSIGLFLLIVWGLSELLATSPRLARCGWGLGIAALAVFLGCTSVQLRYWRDGVQVFRHALQVTRDNYIACSALGKNEEDAGRNDVAFELFTRAVKIEPRYAPAQYNLGTALLDRGRLDEAISHFAMAVKSDPTLSEAHYNWGKALMDQGRFDEAAEQFSKAAKLKPDDAEAHFSLGTVLLKQSREAEAIAQFFEALRLKPDYLDAHQNLAFALMNQGRIDDGVAHFSEVVRLEPTNAGAHIDLGVALLDQNEPKKAEARFAEALRLKPQDAQIHSRLATALIRQHKSKDAIVHYREAMRLQSGDPETLNALAWILASDPDTGPGRNQEAVRLAEEACELTQYKEAAFVVTLAAAHAQAGQYSNAVAFTQQARDLAVVAGNKDVSSRAEELLKLFESGRSVKQALNSSSRDSR